MNTLGSTLPQVQDRIEKEGTDASGAVGTLYGKKITSETIIESYLEKVHIAFETSKFFSVLGVFDNSVARNICRKWCIGEGGFYYLMVNSALRSFVGFAIGSVVGVILGSWTSFGNPRVIFGMVKYFGLKVGAVVGAFFGAYCWQSVEYADTYRRWRQENFNIEADKIFKAFLNQNEKLKKYLCPITHVLCLYPIKIERITEIQNEFTKKVEKKTEIFYYSGFDLNSSHYVKAVEKHAGNIKLKDEDMRIDLLTYEMIYKTIHELLDEQDLKIKNKIIINNRKKKRWEPHVDSKENIVLDGLNQIRQSLIDYGKVAADAEIEKMKDQIIKNDYSENAIRSRECLLKFRCLPVDLRDNKEALQMYVLTVKEHLYSSLDKKEITAGEYKKRFMEIAFAEVDFKTSKSISLEEFTSILLRNINLKEN